MSKSFEPMWKKKLGQICGELASEASREPEKIDRNIELALQHSYKESF